MAYITGRGGAREGAGRPKGKKSVEDKVRRNRIGIRLPAYMIDWLRSQDDMNPGRLIEIALVNTYKKEMEKKG